jgi:protocatechuate 3,4-dioxygenase beta subunit
MARLRLFAVTAAAATVAGLASAGTASAAPVAAPRHPAAPATSSVQTHAAIQWLPGSYGKVSGLVRYPGGLTARIAPRRPSPVDGTFGADAGTAVRADVRAPKEPTRPALTLADVPATEQATLKGRVTDGLGDPLAGVVVEVYAEAQEPAASTTTDSTGFYTLTLPDGPYSVEFDGSQATGGNADSTGYVDTEDQVTLAAGAHVRRNARLPAGAQLRVRVTDRAGHPLAGVSPYLQPITTYVLNPTGSDGLIEDFATDARTGADGTLTFRGVPSDAVLVCVSAADRQPSGGAHDALGYADRCSRHPVAPAPASSTDFPTIQLNAAPGGAIAGIVTNGNGAPIANAEVDVEGGFEGESALTGSDGSYQLSGLPPGSYHVCAYPIVTAPTGFGHRSGCHNGTVVVRRDAVTHTNVVLLRGGAITGTVTGPSGAPVSGVVVDASGPKDEEFGITDGDGHYRVNGLPTGSYRLCFESSGAVDPDQATGDGSTCDDDKIAVQAGAVHAGVDAQLQAGGAVAGRVTGVGGAADPDVDVFAEPVSGDSRGGVSVTDSHGDYRISGLTPGSYRLCFEIFDPANLGISDKCGPGTVDVQAGETTEFDRSLAPPPSRGSIEVTVRDEAGRRVQGVDVVVLKPCGGSDPFVCESEPLFGHPGAAKLVDSRMADNAGRGGSDGRKPGRYAVCLFAYYGVTTDGAPQAGYSDRCAGGSFDVTVSAGQTTRVHLTLHPGGRVEGRVVDPAGHPVPHVRVHVSQSAPDDYIDVFGGLPIDLPVILSPRADTATHQDGTFSIRGVRPGHQKVCARPAMGSNYLRGCAGHPVVVTANATTQMPDLALRRAGAVSGVVRDAAGHRLRLAAVAVFTTAKRPDLVDSELVQANGRYRIAGLPSGRYVVCFAAPHRVVECYRNVPWHMKRHPLPPHGTVKVRVTAGHTTTGIDAKLPRRK